MKFSLFVLALVIGASSAFLSSSDKSMLDLDSSCGKGTALRRKRIIGGSASAATNHGWHVLIKDANGMNKCGGSLIHDYWVVTAASCVSNNLNPSSYTLEFGIVDRNGQSVITLSERDRKYLFTQRSIESPLEMILLLLSSM